jgi:DNA-binding response OmpR family regulator
VLGRSRATIVVLEKNPAVRELIDQTLRESGDRVLVTSDPIEALNLARRVRVDLLVSDVAVLDRDEQALLSQLQSSEQGLRVIHFDDPDEPRVADSGGDLTLDVPFSLEELQEAVAAMLGRGT